jgi:small nuclear ribonucleoprotein F
MPINPRPMLQNLYVLCSPTHLASGLWSWVLLTLNCHRVNEEVIIRLKWGQTEYKGRLVSIDSYMNIQLSGAEEWIDQQMTSVLGQVLIRYVLYRIYSYHKKAGVAGVNTSWTFLQVQQRLMDSRCKSKQRQCGHENGRMRKADGGSGPINQNFVRRLPRHLANETEEPMDEDSRSRKVYW